MPVKNVQTSKQTVATTRQGLIVIVSRQGEGEGEEEGGKRTREK